MNLMRVDSCCPTTAQSKSRPAGVIKCHQTGPRRGPSSDTNARLFQNFSQRAGTQDVGRAAGHFCGEKTTASAPPPKKEENQHEAD